MSFIQSNFTISAQSSKIIAFSKISHPTHYIVSVTENSRRGLISTIQSSFPLIWWDVFPTFLPQQPQLHDLMVTDPGFIGSAMVRSTKSIMENIRKIPQNVIGFVTRALCRNIVWNWNFSQSFAPIKLRTLHSAPLYSLNLFALRGQQRVMWWWWWWWWCETVLICSVYLEWH